MRSIDGALQQQVFHVRDVEGLLAARHILMAPGGDVRKVVDATPEIPEELLAA